MENYHKHEKRVKPAHDEGADHLLAQGTWYCVTEAATLIWRHRGDVGGCQGNLSSLLFAAFRWNPAATLVSKL